MGDNWLIENLQRFHGNIDGFIAASSKVVSKTINTIHSLNPTEIDICGAKALSESFCTMTSRFEHHGFDYDKVSTVRLISRLEKLEASRDLAWKLLTLDCIYIRDSIIAVTPQPADTIPSFEGSEKFPKAYRYSAWLLSTIGIKSRDDLPREDDPQSVAKVFTANEAWMRTA